MPLDKNQVTNGRRLLGYTINGNPTETKNILVFNDTLKSFEFKNKDELVGKPYEIQVTDGKVTDSKTIEIFAVSDTMGGYQNKYGMIQKNT